MSRYSPHYKCIFKISANVMLLRATYNRTFKSVQMSRFIIIIIIE